MSSQRYFFSSAMARSQPRADLRAPGVGDDPGIDARLPEGYRLVDEAPAVEDYLALRARAGLSPKSREQAEAALPGSWAACHVVHGSTGETVGMGRILGDGGWYFHVVHGGGPFPPAPRPGRRGAACAARADPRARAERRL